MEGPMPVYVVRLNDGSCLIGEADSELQAREEFVSRWDSSGSEQKELILSIREMPKDAFLSRWWPSEHARDEGLLPGQLDGGISDDSDVYEKEYPIIEAAHKKASDEMACFSDRTPIDPAVFDWDAKIRSNLTEAVRAEMRRGNMQTKSIQ